MNARQSSQKDRGPTDIDLANYAKAYMAAYMSAVQSESPEHIPQFYKNHPYGVEVCYMPNGSFCMLFERAERPTIAVSGQEWDYVMGKIMSGVFYLATVYSHEGASVEDASSRGRRDAIRDIRAMESSDIVDATRQLENIVRELSDVNQWMKNPVKMADSALARLEPLKQTIARSGPIMDKMSMVDGLRRYSTGPSEMKLDSDGIEMLSSVVKQMTDLSELLRDVKLQGEKLEEIENHLRTEVHDFKIELDKKIAKGLGVILSTTDRKIDKAFASIQPSQQEDESDDSLDDLYSEVNSLREAVDQLNAEEKDDTDERLAALSDEVLSLKDAISNIKVPMIEPPVMPEPKIPAELLIGMRDVRGEVGQINLRVKRIEEYLTALSAARRSSNR
ncbi:MAG: hypothetical protein E4H25_02775 [Methanomassiliicoccus sp.]|nr:MAG: hypothetical protein E4H25_02775 [Methanomassiliicoccus sp.]